MNWLPFAGEVASAIGSGWFSHNSAKEAYERQKELWTYMQSNAHQLEVGDLKAAGLNPILSANHSQLASMPSVYGATNPGMDLGDAINSSGALSLQRKLIDNQHSENLKKIGIAMQEANTNFINAETNRQKNAIELSNLELKKKFLEFDQYKFGQDFGLRSATTARQLNIQEGQLSVARGQLSALFKRVENEGKMTDAQVSHFTSIIRKNILEADITEYYRNNLLGELGSLTRELSVASAKERMKVIKSSPELYRVGYLGKLLNPLLPNVSLGFHN